MIPATASLVPRLSELTLPLLIIAGAADEISDPVDQSQRLANSVPGSVLLLLEGIGHMVHYSARTKVVDAIKAQVVKGQEREPPQPGLPVAIAAPVA